MSVDTSRLDRCGWTSFDADLFLNEPGRKSRDVGGSFVRLLTRFSKGDRVLELCCGVGPLCIALARAGYTVTGVDLSNEMLAVFTGQLAREGEQVRQRVSLVQADMCTFELDGSFDFVILEDDGFGYLLSYEEQTGCLERIHKHLSEDGHFFLGCVTPQRNLATPEQYEYDPIRQIKTARCEWTVVDESGNQKTVRQGIERRRLIYPCELELLMKTASFDILHRWGDRDGTPFTDPDNQDYSYLMAKAQRRSR